MMLKLSAIDLFCMVFRFNDMHTYQHFIRGMIYASIYIN